MSMSSRRSKSQGKDPVRDVRQAPEVPPLPSRSESKDDIDDTVRDSRNPSAIVAQPSPRSQRTTTHTLPAEATLSITRPQRTADTSPTSSGQENLSYTRSRTTSDSSHTPNEDNIEEKKGLALKKGEAAQPPHPATTDRKNVNCIAFPSKGRWGRRLSNGLHQFWKRKEKKREALGPISLYQLEPIALLSFTLLPHYYRAGSPMKKEIEAARRQSEAIENIMDESSRRTYRAAETHLLNPYQESSKPSQQEPSYKRVLVQQRATFFGTNNAAGLPRVGPLERRAFHGRKHRRPAPPQQAPEDANRQSTPSGSPSNPEDSLAPGVALFRRAAAAQGSRATLGPEERRDAWKKADSELGQDT